MAKSKKNTPKDTTPKGFGTPMAENPSVAEKRSKSRNEAKQPSGVFGFTPQAELWNGRLAMVGFIALVAIEFLTHQGILKLLGLQ